MILCEISEAAVVVTSVSGQLGNCFPEAKLIINFSRISCAAYSTQTLLKIKLCNHILTLLTLKKQR